MSTQNLPVLYLVVPCYNEQEVLPETARRVRDKLVGLMRRGTIAPTSRVLFVDDGSRDATWRIICELHSADALYSGLKLSRNRGHQNALLAGLLAAAPLCDATISMDADLQDDLGAIDAFLESYAGGCDIVYGVRSKRETDTVFKRSTARAFYKFMLALGVEIVDDHADYRLMSRRAVEALGQYSETNLFLRGVVPLIGFKTATVPYERSERFAGESKYPLKKMLAFAWEGVTSFSVRPLRLITTLGCAVLAASAVALIALALTGRTGLGIASLWLLGGIQLCCLGIAGEYIGKIYSEVKRRPRFFIETLLNDETTCADEPPVTEI